MTQDTNPRKRPFDEYVDLTNGGMPDGQAALICEASEQASHLDVRLKEEAQRLIEKLQRVIAHVDEGYGVNSLGELQSSAPQFDILCAQREDAHHNEKRIRHALLGKS